MIECPKCFFNDVVEINTKLYQCINCHHVFSPIEPSKKGINLESLINYSNNNAYSYSFLPKPTETKDTSQKFKLNTYSKGEGIEKVEYSTIDFENTTGAAKPAGPMVKETGGNCRDIVLHFMNEMNPPEFSSAAHKIKESVEKHVKETHNIHLKSTEASIMFNQITKDNQLSDLCIDIWNLLDKFIANDDIIGKRFVNDQSKKNFFQDTIDLFEKINILKKK